MLHAHVTEHAYPAHTHELWTVLLVDTGGVAYELHWRPRAATPRSLTLLPPHRYVTSRRVDRARRLLLDGMPAAGVAVAVGFHDQAHLTGHFCRMLGVTPVAYARHAS
ncbi:MAG: helix-turn-helix domain-containing protein [Aeromicrobium sp.]